MSVPIINFNSFNVTNNKSLPNYPLFVQKPDIVSFSGKKAFSFTPKGILQNTIDECKNKEIVEPLLKNDEGLYKYKPFTVFEILTQKDKPNFTENLKALQDFRFDGKPISPSGISEMLAACDGQDVKQRLEILNAVKEEKGINLPLELFCTDNDKFSMIKKCLEGINNYNKKEVIAICGIMARPEISEPQKMLSAKEKLLNNLFGIPKRKKDGLEKLIASGKYKNISTKALKNYKEEHFKNYVELYRKAKFMPQILDLINHIVGLGRHSRYKESWIRNSLKGAFDFERVANIFLQKESPQFITETEILGKLLFGEQRPELKSSIKGFKKRTGINMYADSNIPVSYIDRFEKLLPDLKKHYGENSSIVGVNITNIIQESAGGFCINSGITIPPSKLNNNFERVVFHECAHVAHQRCIPWGEGTSRQGAWSNLINKKFYPKDSLEYKTTVTQLRPYAAETFAEFVAVMNEQIGIGKFEVVINEKGEKVLRKYLKDGDKTTAKDLETLMNIYESVWGPDIGAKEASASSSEYVETPFKGAQKFDYIKYILSKKCK